MNYELKCIEKSEKVIYSTRQSNFELLRIVSMCCIIMHHYAFHGGIIQMGSYTNRIIGQCLTIGGGLGVNCFIMISSWFLINSKFKFRSLLKIIFETFFYSVTITLALKITGLKSVSFDDFIKSFAPIVFNRYWFVTSYVCLYLLSPFLNIYINVLNRKQYSSLLLVLTICTVVYIPYLKLFPFVWEIGGGSIIWFVYLYLLIGYYKLNGVKYIDKYSLFLFISALLTIWGGLLVGTYKNSDFIGQFGGISLQYNSALILICSLSLFSIFKKIRIQNRFINIVASTAFGVYLIHDSPYRSYLWLNIVKTQNYFFSEYLLLHAIIMMFVIYLICSLIDYLRIQSFEIFVFNVYDKYFIKVGRSIDSFFNV